MISRYARSSKNPVLIDLMQKTSVLLFLFDSYQQAMALSFKWVYKNDIKMEIASV